MNSADKTFSYHETIFSKRRTALPANSTVLHHVMRNHNGSRKGKTALPVSTNECTSDSGHYRCRVFVRVSFAGTAAPHAAISKLAVSDKRWSARVLAEKARPQRRQWPPRKPQSPPGRNESELPVFPPRSQPSGGRLAWEIGGISGHQKHRIVGKF